MRPRDLASAQILGLRKPHGTRLRYMSGCKCVPCRAANSNYETMRDRRRRMGLWNGLVDATLARNHMLLLSKVGVGRRTVSRVAHISDSVLFKIRSGERKQIRALTEKAILTVSKTDARGSTNVPAGATWQRIGWLLSEGFTKKRIAQEIGLKTPALQLKKDFVSAQNARKIYALWKKYQ